MKHLKHVLLLIVCLGLFNCESESTDTPDPEKETDSTLIKRIVEEVVGEDTYTTNFTYDGNKLINIKDDDGYETRITYTDNKITRIDNLYEGEIEEYFIISYDANGKFSSYKEFLFGVGPGGSDIAYNNSLTYNSDNTVDVEVLRGDFSSQTTPNGTTTYTIINSNISKIEFDDVSDNYTFEYDNQKGFLKNIEGFEVFNFTNYYSEFGFEIYGGINNITKVIDTQESWPTSTERYEYSYNEMGYPTSSKTYYNDDIANSNGEELISNIEYFYE